MLEKCVLIILELNWNQRFRDEATKLNICHHMRSSSMHTTAKQVISRRRKNENVFKMSKDEKMHVQSVQKYYFSLSNMQICGVFVAVVVVVARLLIID